MPRAAHPAVKAAAAAKYVPMLANPIDPLAEEVGKAVVREVTALGHTPPPKAAKGAAGLVIKAEQPGAVALETRITIVVTQVLEQSLSSQTAEGKALRMALIAKLANAEVGSVATSAAKDASADALLTTAEAAAKLEVSRPYVSMLCDSGKLGQVVMTEGGHRRIRASAVQAYLATRTKQHEGAVSPRQAGVEAGLYDYPETHVKVVRGTEPAKKAAPAKAARKPRS